MSRATVLLHLKAILTLVCLNRLVTLRMCGEVKVTVAHFMLFPALVGGVACILLCCIWCFRLWSRVVGNLLFFAMWRMVCHSLCGRSLLRGRVEHPLNVLSVCRNLVFTWVV